MSTAREILFSLPAGAVAVGVGIIISVNIDSVIPAAIGGAYLVLCFFLR